MTQAAEIELQEIIHLFKKKLLRMKQTVHFSKDTRAQT